MAYKNTAKKKKKKPAVLLSTKVKNKNCDKM